MDFRRILPEIRCQSCLSPVTRYIIAPGGNPRMSKIESYVPGSFCWAELATTDAAAAKHFYGEMFGWTAVDMPMPEGVYTLFQADGNDAAAVYTSRPGVPVHWGVYFSVASADESAAAIEPCGGKLIAGPFDAHDAGRMADRQGRVKGK